MEPRKANYEVVEETAAYMLIEDLGPWHEYMSVTNAAENVVAEVFPKLGTRRLFYKDTDGCIDELLVSRFGQFAGFRHLGNEKFHAISEGVH